MKLADIVAALPALTASERKALRVALDSFTDDTSIDLELLGAVTSITGEHVPMAYFRNSKCYKVWLKSQDAFTEVYQQLIPQVSTKVGRVAAKRFLVGLLVEYLKRSHKPVTLLNISIELGNMRKIIDENFPGYLDNKLGGVIMQGIRADKN